MTCTQAMVREYHHPFICHCTVYSQQVESDSNYLFVLDLLLRLHAITNLRGA